MSFDELESFLNNLDMEKKTSAPNPHKKPSSRPARRYSQQYFYYDIEEKVAVISQHGDETLELNRISYRGRPPKYDLRRFRHIDGEEEMLKGLTFTDKEVSNPLGGH